MTHNVRGPVALFGLSLDQARSRSSRSGPLACSPRYSGVYVHYRLSLLIVTALFAAMFKVLPAAKIASRDVWIGAVLTSVLFTVGKFLIGLYLSHSGAANAYGSAGSLVLIVL